MLGPGGVTCEPIGRIGLVPVVDALNVEHLDVFFQILVQKDRSLNFIRSFILLVINIFKHTEEVEVCVTVVDGVRLI